MNVPNTLTMLRVVFAIAVFYFCAVDNWDLCLLFFVLASLTDFVDGWWARKFKQITVFGRIMDPFADKFLICGVFICLVAIPWLTRAQNGVPAWLMLQPWMVIVIVGRELLITSLRAVVEKSGGDFSAKWIGKWKMGVQCVAVIACFLYLTGGANTVFRAAAGHLPEGSIFIGWNGGVVSTLLDSIVPELLWRQIVFYTMIVTLWGTVLITLYSGVSYCVNAVKMIRKPSGHDA